jgi:RNA polymerase II subunit A-like phosphatase
VHDLSSSVTHLVVGKEGTEKMVRATKMPTVFIVRAQWLQNSIALWEHVDEKPFLIHIKGSEKPPEAQESLSGSADVDGDSEMADNSGDGDDDELFGDAWDDDAQAELDRFLNEDDSDDSDEDE